MTFRGIIGVIDSGIIPTHPLLKGSIVASESFGGLNSPFDEQGHGTMVAGIIQFGVKGEFSNSSMLNLYSTIGPDCVGLSPLEYYNILDLH